MKKNNSLVLSVLTLGVVLSLALSGCSTKNNNTEASNTPSQPAKQVTLDFSTIDSKTKLARVQKAIDATEKQVDGLKINVTSYDGTVFRFEKLKAMMTAGSPPDIFALFGGTDTQTYAKTGNLLDLTDFLKESGLDKKFANLEAFTVDGKIYGLPNARFAEGLFYNKKILQDLGATLPTTWQELLDLCQLAKDKGYTPIGMAAKDAWVSVMPMNTLWVRSAGLETTQNLASGKQKWTDPDVVNAFKQFETLSKKGFFTEGSIGYPYAELQNKFMQGKTLFIFDGSWSSGVFEAKDSTLAGQVGFIALPQIPDGKAVQTSINAAVNYGYGFSAKLSDDQKLAAFEFIKQVYTEDLQKQALIEEGDLPSIFLTDTSGITPSMKDVVTTVEKSGNQYPAYDTFLQQTVRALLEENMQKLIAGKITPEELTQTLQKTQDIAIGTVSSK